MAKTVCKILGVVFLLVGVCGFAAPNLLSAHLSPIHNVVHIVSGAIALYFGFAGTLSAAKRRRDSRGCMHGRCMASSPRIKYSANGVRQKREKVCKSPKDF